MDKAWSKKIDKSLKAKKAGYRKSKTTGNYYYEARPNRSDKNPKMRFEEGGMAEHGKMYAKGGMSEHGLKTGDKIVGKSGGMGVKVYNKESREAGTINLDKGSRNVSKYANGGYMAKGGKAKKKEKDPPIVRGYMDDEPYEYGQGGSAGCWCYEIGGL